MPIKKAELHKIKINSEIHQISVFVLRTNFTTNQYYFELFFVMDTVNILVSSGRGIFKYLLK